MNLRRLILAGPRNATMTVLSPMERALLGRVNGSSPPTVFIVGPPRSGTSLLFELLVTRYRFAYFSNAAHRLYRTPAMSTWLVQRAIRRWRGDFQSEYGKIDGLAAPSEGGWIWGRWLPGEETIERSEVSSDRIRQARQTVSAIAGMLHAPFLSKNVMHSVHMQALNRIFPGCVFIEIRRDVKECIRSNLKLRRDKLGKTRKQMWVSVKPQGWQRFRSADPVVQIAAQIFGVRDDIQRSAEYIGPNRRHVVEYERLCRNPEIELQAMARFLASNGIWVDERGASPSAFTIAKSQSLDDATEQDIRQAILAHQSKPAVEDCLQEMSMRAAA